MKFLHILLLFIFLPDTAKTADEPIIDSLIQSLDTASDESRYRIYDHLFKSLIKKDVPRAAQYARKSHTLSINLNDDIKKGSALSKLGIIQELKGNYDSALILYDSSLTVYRSERHEVGEGEMHASMGNIYALMADYESAQNAQLKALRIFEEMKDSSKIASTLLNIGAIYYYWEKNEQTIEYFTRALNIYNSLNDAIGIARCNSNLGSIYFEIGDKENALKYSMQAVEFYRNNGYRFNQAILEGNIGNIYIDQGDYEKGFDYLHKTRVFFESQGNKGRLTSTYNHLGNAYIEYGDFDKADFYLNKSLNNSKETGNMEQAYEVYHSMSEGAEKAGRYKEALRYFKLHSEMRDSIFDINTHEQIEELETRYETEKKENKIKLQQAQLDANQAEIRQHDAEKKGILAAAALILILAGILWYQNIEKQKTNNRLAEKNKSITESITYAKKIQSAVLPPENLINNLVPEHFIYFLPRDIVSGDFYWVTRSKGNTIIAAADCTGHGVPGAFMSMLGFTLLNEIIGEQEVLKANNILNALREKVKKALRQKNEESETQDGIDIALCIIDQDNNKLQYAGANNPMILLRNGKIQKIKGDRMPVGYQISEKKSFTNHELDIYKNDTIYLFSDGYIDQFGGETGQRFRTRPFEELLLSIHHRSMKDQHKILEETLKNWMGDHEQIDDILVLGVKIL